MTAATSFLMVAISDDDTFDEVTADAKALYAEVRSADWLAVGEFVKSPLNWLRSVELPESVAPEAYWVTIESWNAFRADILFGVRPSS